MAPLLSRAPKRARIAPWPNSLRTCWTGSAAAVGAENLRTGDDISEDYTHDEALTVGRRLPDCRRAARPTTDAGGRRPAPGRPSTGSRSPPAGSGTGLSGACIPDPTAASCRFERMNRDPRDRHREPRRRRAARRHARRSSTQALAAARPRLPGVPRREQRQPRRQRRHQRRRHAGGEVRRHPPPGARARGRAARRRGDPHRRQVREGHDRLRPHPADHRLGGHARRSSPRRRCKLHPRLDHRRTVLAPFATLDEVAAAVPRDRRQRRRPADPRVHRPDHDGGASPTQRRARPRHPRRRSRTPRSRTSWSMLESPHEERLDEDIDELAEQLAELGAHRRVRAAARGRPTQLIEAREKAFWVAKANGADDIVDIVVPRAVDPRVPGRGGRAGAGARRRGSPAAATPATATCTSRCSRPTPRSATAVMHDLFAPAIDARRRDLGRARHRHARRSVLPRARGPGEARPHAPDQGRVRPRRHPQPRHHLSTRPLRGATDERRPGPHPHARRQRRRRLLHEPGHLRDALRRRARRRARDARRARAVRGRGHRRGRRLRPHGRPAGRHAAAPRPGPRQRLANLHNARRAAHADREHRRRPRHLPQAVRRAARVRHRDRRPRNVSGWLRTSARPEDVGRRRRRGGGRRLRPARARSPR